MRGSVVSTIATVFPSPLITLTKFFPPVCVKTAACLWATTSHSTNEPFVVSRAALTSREAETSEVPSGDNQTSFPVARLYLWSLPCDFTSNSSFDENPRTAPLVEPPARRRLLTSIRQPME